MADIDALAAKFAKQVNDELTAFRKEAEKSTKEAPPKDGAAKDASSKTTEKEPELKVVVSKQTVSNVRTPKEQAEQIVAGRSWTCSSSHMGDGARHVALQKNGKYVKSPSKDLTREQFQAFKQAWESALKRNGLRNFKNKEVYDESDAYHVEEPDSKLPFSDKRVQECLAHYAQMTREDGEKKNASFESDSKIKKYLDDYDKKKAAKGAKSAK